jgi:hypothetical protein
MHTSTMPIAATCLAVVPSHSPLKPLSTDEFRSKFNRQAFTIEHNLREHSLLNLSKLIDLASALPEPSVEYNAGNLPITQDPNQTPRNGLSIIETIRRIEECQSWMVLKNIEQVPEYKELLHRCLAQVKEVTESIAPGMSHEQGFIFISSPNSVTPFHIDPENNFLLQIRGNKRVQMFDRFDRDVISEEQVEGFFTGAHRNIPYLDSFADRGHWFDLEPGDGLHFPVAAPHWVKNGDAVSISLSITFQTNSSRDTQSVHRLNKRLRDFGMVPKTVGTNRLVDNLKLAIVRCGRRHKGSNA